MVIYIVGLLLVAVAILLFGEFVLGGTNTSTTTIAQNASTTQSTTLPANYSTTLEPTTTILYSGCLSPDPTAFIPNGDFATDTYEDWNVVGQGFGTAPLNLTYANNKTDYYASPWTDANGGYAATTFQKGLALQTGNLSSLPFEVTEPYLNFRIISPENNALYVEILRNSTPVITTHYDTFGQANTSAAASHFLNASIPLVTLLCQQNISIKVVAGVTGKSERGVGFIAVRNFYLSRLPVADKNIIASQVINTS